MIKTYIRYWDCLGVGNTPSILDVACGEVHMQIYYDESGTRGRVMVHPKDGVSHCCPGSCRWLAGVQENLIEFELLLNE